MVPRMPTVMLEVWMSKDSFSSSFCCTSNSSRPEDRLSVMWLFSFKKVTWVMESSVRTLVASSPTDAMAPSLVIRLSPLLKRAFSMMKRLLPPASRICTSPS